MSTIHVEKVNESFARITAEPAVIEEISDHFSFFVPGYRFQPKYTMGVWDGKIRLFKRGSNLLPIGLATGPLDKFAAREDFTVERTDSDFASPCRMTEQQIKDWIAAFDIYSGENKIDPYWYQVDSVVRGLTDGRAVLNLPTSAGKSLIQALLCRWNTEFIYPETSGTTLIIVPSVNLVTQMKSDLLDYRLYEDREVYQISGGVDKKIPRGTQVVISTWQSLAKLPADWFSQFSMLLCDEAHLATGISITKVVEQKMTRCPMKFGLTGTVKKAKANVMQLVGHFGSVFKPTTTKKLMEEGQASDLKVSMLNLEYSMDDRKNARRLKYPQEIAWLCENKRRNMIIAKLAMKAVDADENCLILFNHIKHGNDIQEAIQKIHPEAKKVLMVNGATDKKKREAIRKYTEVHKGVVIVASVGIMSTGVSIKNLHSVVFTHPTKSEVRTLQSVGRILRKHESKEFAILIDIVDDLSYKTRGGKKHWNYALKHGVERMKMYAEERFNVARRSIPM